MPWIEMADRPTPGFKASVREPRRWYQIGNAVGDEAELLLFDEIGGWFGPTTEEIVAELKAITAPKLRVKVNSPGGSVFEGVALANALRAHPAEVTVQVEGLAASIASVIALAGDRLVMMPNSMLMIHEASGGCLGNASDMQLMAEILDKVSDNIADAYAEKAGGTRAEWRQRMKDETWYLADEAVEAGLADEVARPARQDEDDAPAMAAKWDLSVFRYAGRAAAPAPVTAHTDPDPPPADQAHEEPVTPEVSGSSHEQEPPAPDPDPPPADPEPPDGPADETTEADADAPDDWAEMAAHLIEPPSEADEWESMREALL